MNVCHVCFVCVSAFPLKGKSESLARMHAWKLSDVKQEAVSAAPKLEKDN
jgi:hypothetical protein